MTHSLAQPDDRDDADRLEELWQGPFGDAYTARNLGTVERAGFWQELVDAYRPASCLEVGCNVGENLRSLAAHIPAAALAGVDVNEGALASARDALPGCDLRLAPARALPFSDASFELVFTAMVLIHQPHGTLRTVMGEVVRCSRRFCLAIEYESPTVVEVPYREQSGALFKRPYGKLYAEWFPELRLLDTGFRGRNDGGWDDVTWWLFEKDVSVS